MSFAGLMKANFGQGASDVAGTGSNSLKNMLLKCLQALDALVDEGLLTKAGLAIGSTTTAVAHEDLQFISDGDHYQIPANAVGVALGTTETLPDDKFGAVAFDAGEDGTVDGVPCTAFSTGYDSEAEAIAALPACAANHVRIGYITIVRDNVAGFVAGTTDLDDGDTTVVYYDAETNFEGVIAIMPS